MELWVKLVMSNGCFIYKCLHQTNLIILFRDNKQNVSVSSQAMQFLCSNKLKIYKWWSDRP